MFSFLSLFPIGTHCLNMAYNRKIYACFVTQYALLQDFNTLFITKYIYTHISHFQQLAMSAFWFLPIGMFVQFAAANIKNLFPFCNFFFEKIPIFLTNVSKSMTNGQKKGERANCFVPSCFCLARRQI